MVHDAPLAGGVPADDQLINDRLWTPATASELNGVIFSGHKKGVNCLEFSEDGLTLASGGKDCAVILWDVVSESGLFRLNGHKAPITHLRFARGDQFLITSSKDCLIKFWSLKSQSCFYTVFESRTEVYSFSIVNNETLMVVASAEAELVVYQLIWLEEGIVTSSKEGNEPEEKKPLTESDADRNDIEDMANRYLRVIVRGRLLRQCKGRALQLALSPDERFLLCLGADRIVDVYRVFTEAESSKRLAKKLKNAKRKATSCHFLCFSEVISAGISEEDIKKDVTILIAPVGEYRSQAKIKWADFTTKCKVDQDGAVNYSVFALMSNNTVHLLNFKCDISSNTVSFECTSTVDHLGHRSDIRALSVASSNNAIVSGGGDELIIWNVHSLRPVACLRSEGMVDVTACVFATGDGHVVAGTKTGELYLWDVAACELLESRKGHEGAVWAIVHTADGKGFITVSSDKKAKFWSYEVVSEGTQKRLSIRETRILELPDEALCCAVSPDGKFVLIGMLDNTVGVYFFDTLKFFISLYGHSLPVTCVTVSPNSKLAVTGSADKSIKIWGLDFGDCHKSFHAHDDVVSAVLFSPSEEILVWSAGRDGKIKQWDAQKLCHVQTLDRHSAEVRALAQTNNGSSLFSASHDKSLRCWDLTEEIIVVQEEEEMEREKDYEARLVEEEDVVSGEVIDPEASLATVKNTQSVVSAENIIEAVDIVRNEKVQAKENPEHKPHPLIGAYNSKSYDHFIIDVISRCRPSNLERSLLMVPLSYVPDILSALSSCVQQHYRVEFAVRIAIFLIRVHQSHIINSTEMLPVIEKISTEMPGGITDVRDITGFNLAALELLQLELEEAQNIKLFADVSDVASKQKKKNKARKAVIKT
ncbi:hypothetical protein Y032_0012g1735 [Ancylostoma ceylanicum]|uniref:Small-subunit processome Utp12 domain-containing protein n=1 Tax=Ancylostoma ceylanicum TaxID=53326 RepID=A0A016VDR3_9BILA|nr:hypothetical protein Y032_0012g1735 [Ancylostoma ceylanicum]